MKEITDASVIKRDGTLEPIDIKKIRRVVRWACADTGGSPVALEAGMSAKLKDGISTREIQENLINCCLSMCSPTEPDWRYVAGRLHMWSLWKDTLVNRGYQYGDYRKTVASKVAANEYDERILTYSPDELEIAGSWINPDWDRDYDYAGATLLTKRYLLADELPQEAYLTCALLLASVEEPQNRMNWAKKFYEAIGQRKISLATPILANLRVPGGSLSSCFITAMDDNLESIYGTLTDTARISKNGGGVGVNVSRVRAMGSWVMGKPNASGGVVPWIKLINDTAIAVNQGGKRAGAVTVSLDIWHLDILEFLEMQTENGDQRRKAYDIFPQLVVADEFMRRVVAKEDWTLVDPYEVKTKLGIDLPTLWGKDFEQAYQKIEAEVGHNLVLYNRINARELFKTIMRTQVETGMPYLAFKDTINRANPNQHKGYIPGVNLCCESFSNVSPGEEVHCCNLNSLNFANLEVEELPEICLTAVRMLDNTIDLTNPPIKEAGTHNDIYRTIGVGAMGLADWLAKRGFKFQDTSHIRMLFDEMAYWSTRASMELSRERGWYPAFPGSQWQKGKMIGHDLEWFEENSFNPDRWRLLKYHISIHGIRNSHITAIAPNTSSSLVQGCTASILPVFNRFFYDKSAKGSVPIAPPFIQDSFWFYQENRHLDQRVVVEAVSEIQKWIDTGISMELLFNLNEGVYGPERSLKAKDIFETLLMAWQLGCKAVYYVRTVQRDDFKESSDCVSCAN